MNISIFSLWHQGKIHSLSSTTQQASKNSAESEERSILTLASIRLPC